MLFIDKKPKLYISKPFCRQNTKQKYNTFIKNFSPGLDSDFSYTYDFTKRGFWKKLFGQKIEKMDGIVKREIELNTIFNGIKNMLQQRV